MANKKLSPQDAESGQVRNTRAGARRPNTQRPTDKSMTLYTMSGKRTTIAERDNTSEEERMAEIRARLFTLFDEGEAKEREYAEQSKLKNRATGAFMKIKDIIGEGEDGYSAGSAFDGEAPQPVKNSADSREDSEARSRQADFERRSGQSASEARRAARSAQTGRKSGSGSREEARSAQTERAPGRSLREEAQTPKRERIEQERRVKPVNPVRAMDSEKFGRRGRPEMADERESARPRRTAESAAPERARAETPRAGTEKNAEPGRDVSQQETDASFRLGDLFKDKEPDIFSRWEREDEEEKRIRERRERRRAEAAKRVRGENDGSRMKTAAALFIAREGMRNFFGKISGARAQGDEHEAEEREEWKTQREAFEPRNEDGAPSGTGRGAADAGAVKSELRGSRKDHTGRRRAADAFGFPATENAARDDRDDENEEPSFFDFFRRPERPSRTMTAWITGWAAGAVAVVIIAFIIVNNHAIGL